MTGREAISAQDIGFLGVAIGVVGIAGSLGVDVAVWAFGVEGGVGIEVNAFGVTSGVGMAISLDVIGLGGEGFANSFATGFSAFF